MESLRLLTRGAIRINNTDARSKPFVDSLPSSSGKVVIPDGVSHANKKRKRIDEKSAPHTVVPLSREAIREVHKTHNVKISNLKSLRDNSLPRTRKEAKQDARIFPPVLEEFSQLSNHEVDPILLRNIQSGGFEKPSEVQLATIPLLLDHDDQVTNLLTIAPTGSGKTLAFLVPLLNRISKARSEDRDSENSPLVLVLAPTKELVSQIADEAQNLSKGMGMNITVFDSSASSGKKAASKTSVAISTHLLVTTPGSLAATLTPSQGRDDNLLGTVEEFVLDEADVLLDPLFQDQTLQVWSRLDNDNLRVSLWSATIGSNIETLTKSIIIDREERLQITPSSIYRCVIGLKDSSLPSISHKLIYASTEQGKLTSLRQLVHPASSSHELERLRPPFLVFTQTIERAKALLTELEYEMPRPIAVTGQLPTSRVAVLHSHLDPTQRADTMRNFRLGKTWVLITTDLLSRGIDFRGVNVVINYDIPTTSASYVHRAGRTGRAGRIGGKCVTLYTKEDIKYLKSIASVVARSRKAHGSVSVEQEEIPDWLLASLPDVSKNDKKELKQRGVGVRRGYKESDDKDARRVKARNAIGTRSGYEKKLQNRQQAMREASKRRAIQTEANILDDDDGLANDFDGFE